MDRGGRVRVEWNVTSDRVHGWWLGVGCELECEVCGGGVSVEGVGLYVFLVSFIVIPCVLCFTIRLCCDVWCVCGGTEEFGVRVRVAL